MVDLASLTDNQQSQTPIVGNSGPSGVLNNAIDSATGLVNSAGTLGGIDANKIANRLFGLNGEERYQTWPEKLVRDALTPTPEWSVDQTTGDVHTSSQMIKQGVAASALGGTGGIAGVGEGADAALGSAPFLRPALKYQGKIYKAPMRPDAQHLDAIPDSIYPEFQRQAMSGEDISNFNFGFMNHKGQFLNREDALDYAIKEGLVDKSAGQYGALTSTLMSDSSKPGTAIEAMGNKSNYTPTEKYHQVVPEVNTIKLDSLKRKDMNEIAEVKPDQAQEYKQYLNEPINVSLFSDGDLRIMDGHHRVAAAKALGIDRLPVKLQGINAKGSDINKLIQEQK